MLKSNYSSSSSSFSLEKRSSDEKNENLHKHEIKQPHIIIPHPPEMPETFDSFLTKYKRYYY